MRKFVVVYTDPAWARTRDGGSDPKRASIEREIFSDCCEIRIAKAQSGRYPTDGPELSELVRGADALVIHRVEISPELLADAGNQLKVVARQGVGFDNLHPELLRSRGIVGFNVPDYCVDEVAAHTVGLILAIERGIVVQHTALASGRFDVYHGGVPRRLQALTAGVVGFGRIGRVVAARLRNFYGRVVACDPLIEADQIFAYGVEKLDFESLLSTCDVVTLHCPLSPETRGMVNAHTLSLMKSGALLINAARGGLVVAAALRDALRQGRIGGAGLDVFSPEDPSENIDYREILTQSNVIGTSHRAFLSADAEISQRTRVAKGLRSLLEMGELPTVGVLT